MMFTRFTERAQEVVRLAQDEARALKHNYIGTEHILLGLLREEDSMGARALAELGLTIHQARVQIRRIVGEGDEVIDGQLPFTPRAKKLLELSLREALSLGHNYIGTEHILLALVREGGGIGARILLEVGTIEDVRTTVMRLYGLNVEKATVFGESQPGDVWSGNRTVRAMLDRGAQKEMADLYARVKRDPREGSLGAQIMVHAQACGFVAYIFDVHPDTVARAVADDFE